MNTKLKYTFLFLIVCYFFASCIVNNIYFCEDFDEERSAQEYKNQIVLQPDSVSGKDAYIEKYPLRDFNNRNFGGYKFFQASAWTSDGIPLLTRCLIEFDLSELPENAKIGSAILVLQAAENTAYGTGHSGRSGENSFYVRRIVSQWDEQTVSWNNQPATTRNSEVLVAGTDNAMLEYKIVVTKLVQEMIEKPEKNHGFMFQLETEEFYRRVLFASSDNTNQTKHPKLIIGYN